MYAMLLTIMTGCDSASRCAWSEARAVVLAWRHPSRHPLGVFSVVMPVGLQGLDTVDTSIG